MKTLLALILLTAISCYGQDSLKIESHTLRQAGTNISVIGGLAAGIGAYLIYESNRPVESSDKKDLKRSQDLHDWGIPIAVAGAGMILTGILMIISDPRDRKLKIGLIYNYNLVELTFAYRL